MSLDYILYYNNFATNFTTTLKLHKIYVINIIFCLKICHISEFQRVSCHPSVYPEYDFHIFKKFKFKTKFGILKLKGKPCVCILRQKYREKSIQSYRKNMYLLWYIIRFSSMVGFRNGWNLTALLLMSSYLFSWKLCLFYKFNILISILYSCHENKIRQYV